MTRVISLNAALRGGIDFIYIGRAGHGYDGYYGNQHPVHTLCTRCNVNHSRESSVAAFRVDFHERLRTDPEYKRRIELLRGKTLACPGNCRPHKPPCHGDVIVEYLDGLSEGGAKVPA